MTLVFSKTVFDENANNGLGEWRARFDPDAGVAKAFRSAAAKPGIKENRGVTMSAHQIDQRIGQLSEGMEKLDADKAKVARETIAQLETGRRAIEHRVSAPKATVSTVSPARGVA